MGGTELEGCFYEIGCDQNGGREAEAKLQTVTSSRTGESSPMPPTAKPNGRRTAARAGARMRENTGIT